MSELELRAERHAANVRDNRALIAQCEMERRATQLAIALSRQAVATLKASSKAVCADSMIHLRAAEVACQRFGGEPLRQPL